jgi:hypothetical protein
MIEIDIKPSSKHDIFWRQHIDMGGGGACAACVSKLTPNCLERIYDLLLK